MNRLLLSLLPFALAACEGFPHKVSGYTYTDSKGTRHVWIDAEAKESKNDTTLVVLGEKPDEDHYMAIGKFAHQSKIGDWKYKTGAAEDMTVSWNKTSINRLGIETNLPAKSSSSVLPDNSELITFPYGGDTIFVQFYVDTTAPMRKKRIPFEEVVKQDFQNNLFSLTEAKNTMLTDSVNVINMSTITFRKDSSDYYACTAYGELRKGYLAFVVRFKNGNQSMGNILFDGILTNLFLSNELFYDPFKKGPWHSWSGRHAAI